jgi:hypothetical protein
MASDPASTIRISQHVRSRFLSDHSQRNQQRNTQRDAGDPPPRWRLLWFDQSWLSTIRVKRGSLFSLDDVNNDDLIFLGSPSENLTLAEIPSTQEFIFRRLGEGPRKGDLAIVNVHPQANESETFLASPSTSTLSEDYAVIGLMPGLDPARSVMIFAGTTTFGTQAAAEYVCRQLRDLLSRLSISSTGEVQPFEALLHVKVTRGVPVETQLLAVRERTH